MDKQSHKNIDSHCKIQDKNSLLLKIAIEHIPNLPGLLGGLHWPQLPPWPTSLAFDEIMLFLADDGGNTWIAMVGDIV